MAHVRVDDSHRATEAAVAHIRDDRLALRVNVVCSSSVRDMFDEVMEELRRRQARTVASWLVRARGQSQ